MAKRRLSNEKRDIILRAIRDRVRNVTFKNTKEGVERLHRAIGDRATALAKKHFPPKDMVVLSKYNKAEEYQNLSCVAVDERGVQRHGTFATSEAVMLPRRRFSGEGRATIEYDDVIWDLEKQHDTLDDEYHDAVDKVMADYRAFVYECRYFEDVRDMIPEVADLEKTLFGKSRAISLVSRDVLKRIEADQKEVKK